MYAHINRIIPTTLIDGPGVRMGIFFQGCNLRCKYCHNPETQNYCSCCGGCSYHCPSKAVGNGGVRTYRKELCKSCFLCLKNCSHQSSPLYQRYSVDELVKKILANYDFLDGVTFSGGECTLQSKFIISLIQAIRAETHMLPITNDSNYYNQKHLLFFINTNGYMHKRRLDSLLPWIDGVILDLKILGHGRHRWLTGVDNNPIIRNAKIFAKKQKLYEVRTVLIPGISAVEQEIIILAKFIKKLRKISDKVIWKLIPFHKQGVVKEFANKTPNLTISEYDRCFKRAAEVLEDAAAIVCVSLPTSSPR